MGIYNPGHQEELSLTHTLSLPLSPPSLFSPPLSLALSLLSLSLSLSLPDPGFCKGGGQGPLGPPGGGGGQGPLGPRLTIWGSNILWGGGGPRPPWPPPSPSHVSSPLSPPSTVAPLYVCFIFVLTFLTDNGVISKDEFVQTWSAVSNTHICTYTTHYYCIHSPYRPSHIHVCMHTHCKVCVIAEIHWKLLLHVYFTVTRFSYPSQFLLLNY